MAQVGAVVAKYPHCNQNIIHRPGECYYCDKYPHLQMVKYALDDDFSDEINNGWSGNVAVKEGEVHSHMGATFVVGESDLP